MSGDTENKREVFTDLTFDDIIEHLTSKNQDVRCEVCDSDTWGILSAEDDRIPVIPIVGNNLISIKAIKPIISIECQVCGNMKFFAYHAIKRSLEKHRQKNEKGE